MKEIANTYQRTVKIAVVQDGLRRIHLECTRERGSAVLPAFLLRVSNTVQLSGFSELEIALSDEEFRDLQVAIAALLRYSEQQWEAVEVGAA